MFRAIAMIFFGATWRGLSFFMPIFEEGSIGETPGELTGRTLFIVGSDGIATTYSPDGTSIFRGAPRAAASVARRIARQHGQRTIVAQNYSPSPWSPFWGPLA